MAERSWDGHTWRRNEKGHVHKGDCHFRGRVGGEDCWCLFQADPHPVTWRVTDTDLTDASKGLYDHEGHTLYLRGHTHSEQECAGVHKFQRDRWLYVPPETP